MKKVKAQETYMCAWCKEQGNTTTLAVWRSHGVTVAKAACAVHQEHLHKYELARRIRDDHLSEGDEQSWGRL